MGGVVIILILGILIVAGIVAVIGWAAGWWLTAETDAHGEPAPRQAAEVGPTGAYTPSGPPAGRPAHTSVEDEADQRIVGDAGIDR